MKQMFINGRFTTGHATEPIQVINPATEEILGEVPRGMSSEASRIIGILTKGKKNDK